MADWTSDIVTKAMLGCCTILIGVAVHSLQSMSAEIKDLSKSVYELSSQSQLLAATLNHLEKRIEKMEQRQEAERAPRR